MDFLAALESDASADEGKGPRDVAGAELAVVLATGAEHGRRRSYGRGRHGAEVERKALLAHARGCKAVLALKRTRTQMADTVVRAFSMMRSSFAKRCYRVVKVNNAKRRVLKFVCKRPRIHDRRLRGVSYDQVADLAYIQTGRLTAVANACNISKERGSILRRFASAAFLDLQNKSLGRLAQAASELKPLFCMSRLAYDKTGERLTTHENAQTSVWQVFIARMDIVVGWWVDGRCKVVRSEVVLPSALVASPNADNIDRTLFGHPAFMPVMAALRVLHAASEWQIDLHETDGTYAVARLWAFLVSKQSGSRPLDCHFVCRLHATQLIEALALSQPQLGSHLSIARACLTKFGAILRACFVTASSGYQLTKYTAS